MTVAVLGGTGAIGSQICKTLVKCEQDVCTLNSSNFNMLQEHLDISVLEKVRVFIHCAGTFGGLRQYVSEGVPCYEDYFKNLRKVVRALEVSKSSLVINISSGALANQHNFDTRSQYYEYVTVKRTIEDIFNNSELKNVLTIRPTNIVSNGERVVKSGHVLASLYKNIANTADRHYRVWSNVEDWREFTDASDLSSFIALEVKKKLDEANIFTRELIHCSNGEKVFIKQIVYELSNIIHGMPPASEVYTEESRPGPLTDLLCRSVNTQTYRSFQRHFRFQSADFVTLNNPALCCRLRK